MKDVKLPEEKIKKLKNEDFKYKIYLWILIFGIIASFVNSDILRKNIIVMNLVSEKSIEMYPAINIDITHIPRDSFN